MNKLLLSILIALLVFITNMVRAQTITGRVLEKGELPISYATVQITEKYGVLTNEEGRFLLEAKKFKPTDTITISYLGYKSIKLALKDFKSKDYYLIEDINTLSEIKISNKKLSIEEILEKVKENVSKNYATANIKQQIFHRSTNKVKFKRFEFEFTKSNLLNKQELKKLNASIDSLITTVVNVPSTNYDDVLSELYTLQDTSVLKMIKATRLINKKNDKSEKIFQELFLNTVAKHLDTNETYKVKSGLFKVEDSLKVKMDFDTSYRDSIPVKFMKNNYNEIITNNSISKESKLDFIFKTKKYKYELKGTSMLDNELIYVIGFSPKRKSAKFEGIFYVNAYDFAVVKTDFKYAKNRSGKGVNLRFLLGVKFKENLKNISVLYKKNENGLYSLQFIKQEKGVYVYAHRPFKFTKNRKSRAEDKKMMKIDFLMEMNQVGKEELFFISEKQLTKSEFDKIKQKKKCKVTYISKYNAAIWKGYNVINPIEEIKNYDTGEVVNE